MERLEEHQPTGLQKEDGHEVYFALLLAPSIIGDLVRAGRFSTAGSAFPDSRFYFHFERGRVPLQVRYGSCQRQNRSRRSWESRV